MRFALLALFAIGSLSNYAAWAAHPTDPIFSSTLFVGPFSGPRGPDVASALATELTAFERLAGRGTTEGRPATELLSATIVLQSSPPTMPGKLYTWSIVGALASSPAGALHLTVAIPSMDPIRLVALDGDTRALGRRAAEMIEGPAYPADFVLALIRSGRAGEAPCFARVVWPGTTPSERPGLLLHWDIALSLADCDPVGEAALYRRALALQPTLWPAWTDLMSVDFTRGWEETAWIDGQTMNRLARASGACVPPMDE